MEFRPASNARGGGRFTRGSLQDPGADVDVAAGESRDVTIEIRVVVWAGWGAGGRVISAAGGKRGEAKNDQQSGPEVHGWSPGRLPLARAGQAATWRSWAFPPKYATRQRRV